MIQEKRIRHLIASFFLLFLFLNAFGQFPVKHGSKQDSIVNFAESYLGTPYLYGGATPKGFDCSGFVHFVFKHFTLEVPRSSEDFAHFGREIQIDSCKKGDIILFTGTNYDHSRVGHVGIIISNRDEPLKFIHSSSSKTHWGVTVTDYRSSRYPSRFIGIRRLD
jgi:cell wall-associated NlpC family hydrolase